MSLRQHLPNTPVPAYRSASRQSETSNYSTAGTSVPPNQTGYDPKIDGWEKQQPDWKNQHQERFAPPPPLPSGPYGSGYRGYGAASGVYPGGGFDPKYDHINNAPPTRDAKRGMYGTMCCGSPAGVCAWVVGLLIGIAVLIVILLKLFDPSIFNTSHVISSNNLQSFVVGSTHTTTVTATPSISISTVSSVVTTTMTSVTQLAVTAVNTVVAFTTAPADGGH